MNSIRKPLPPRGLGSSSLLVAGPFLSLLKSLINEVLIENDLIPLPDSEPRTKRFEMNLEDDLDSFGDVFKAIA